MCPIAPFSRKLRALHVAQPQWVYLDVFIYTTSAGSIQGESWDTAAATLADAVAYETRNLVTQNDRFLAVMLSRKAKHLALTTQNPIHTLARFFAALRFAQTCP
jgi:hypothetical protein